MEKHNVVHIIKNAILRGEHSYKGVELPKPQTSGTAMQQVAYAKQKADEIYETNFK